MAASKHKQAAPGRRKPAVGREAATSVAEPAATPGPEVLRALVELSHAAVILVDARGRIRSWNPAAAEIFGYSAPEVMGRPITRLIPPRLRRKHRSLFQRRVQAPQGPPFSQTLEVEGLHRDGHEVPIELHLVTAAQGPEPAFTAIIHDVSEQRRVVEQLNDALQRLRFHIERMPLGYIVWDVDFRVVKWNPAAQRMFGYEKAEALGKHAYELIVPSEAREIVDRVWAELMLGDTSSQSLNVNMRKDGSRLTCEWFNTPLRDSSGQIRGVASMVMDVSEREAIEVELRNAQKLESLGVLASGVAHDFNSLLTVIIANTALLRSVKHLPPRAQEYVDLIEEAGFRAGELIEHLMTYARSGRHSPQPTNLNQIVRDAVPFVQRSIGSQHTIHTRLKERLPVVRADHGQIEQILLNLCLNARQAMANGGAIEVATRRSSLTAERARRCVPPDVRPGKYVELTVIDTGCGMSKDMAARIFDPFFSTSPEGHGLGLAAVLGILRQHRGAALVDSVEGKGTSIHVYIPVEQSPV